MRKLNVTLVYQVTGTTSIYVPDSYSLEEAIAFAKENIASIPLPETTEYISDSDAIDEENCDFEEEEC